VIAAGVTLAGFGSATPAGAATLFTLTGHGWGHGIGLSQYGALGYAEHGWSYPRILTHYFTGTHIAPATKPFTERVLLLDGVAHVDLTFGSPAKVGAKGIPAEAVPAGRYRIQLGTTPGRLQLVNRASGKLVLKGLVPPVAATPLATALQLNQPAGIWDANHHWRGSLHVHRSGNRLMLVDWIPIEKYVAAVVPNEVSASWPKPAVRTQAVAVRSYAYATRDPGRVYDATLSDQTYGPIEREAAQGTAAALATKTNVVWFGTTIATTFYSSSSGGRTSSEHASWGTPGPGPGYLKPVADPYDAAAGANPNHTWAPTRYTGKTLARAFGYASPVRSVDQTWDGPSLREQTLVLHTAAANRKWTGLGAAEHLGLRSNYFRVIQVTLNANSKPVKSGGTITVTGRVWPRPTASVKLLRRVAGTSAWTVATPKLVLGTGGRFTFTTTAVSSRSYRLGLASGAISPVVSVTVS
jgi:SpoIID/LytB domain protein